MNISFNEMRSYIENFNRNVEDYERLLEKLKAYGHDTKVTAVYGFNSFGSNGDFRNSKILNKVIERDEILNKLDDYAYKINAVTHSEKVLNKEEREIIEFLKLGITYKLSVIARLTGKKKKYIFDKRNKAIIKMCEYIGGFK